MSWDHKRSNLSGQKGNNQGGLTCTHNSQAEDCKEGKKQKGRAGTWVGVVTVTEKKKPS